MRRLMHRLVGLTTCFGKANGGGKLGEIKTWRRSTRSRKDRRQVLLEHLENRLLLSHFGSSPVLLDDGLLIAEAGDTDDVVSFGFPNPTTARLTINGVDYDYQRDAVRELDVSGGGGNDRIEAPDVDIRVRLSGGDGDDTLVGGADWDVLDSGSGADSLVGGSGNDEVSFKPGDTVLSGDGSDSLQLFVFGGEAADVAQFANLDALTVRLSFNGQTIDYDRAELVSVAIAAGAGDDSVWLNADVSVPAVILGGDGNDTLRGGAEADFLDSGLGSDWLEGGGGNDQLLFKPNDTVISGEGADSLGVQVTGTTGPDAVQVANLADGITTRLTINGAIYDFDRAEFALLAVVVVTAMT